MIDGYIGFTPIGHGGFSTVYLAHQEIFDRQVAVKVLHADLSDADAQRRFVRECRATGRLTGHPHVVTVFDAGATRDRRPYLAMEYFPCGSLAGRVMTNGPIDVPTVVTTGVAVADALDAAHRADILHRDLKPANILLRTPTHPVLSDFGIASLDLNADADAATVSAAFTPGYAAPEILLGEEPTQVSDVFALGATLFSLLRGAPPHPGRAPVQVLNRILEHGPDPLGRDDVPPELSALLTQMLDRDPARRPASAAEVVHRLTALAPATSPASHHLAPTLVRPAAAAASALPLAAPEAQPVPLPAAAPAPAPASTPTKQDGRPAETKIAFIVLTTVLAVVLGGVLLLLRPGGDGSGDNTEDGSGARVTAGADDADLADAPKGQPGSTGPAGSESGSAASGSTGTPTTSALPPGVTPGASGGEPGTGGLAGGQPSLGASVAPTAQPPPASPVAPAVPPAPPPATQAPAGPGCLARAQGVTDYQGRRHPTRYYCSTYVSYGVYSNVQTGQGDQGLDDSGYMYAAASVWVICQLQGRPNPVVQGNTNTWWLYTQGDESRPNAHGYSAGWGYLPATVVTVGGQNEPIPGVPTCGSYL